MLRVQCTHRLAMGILLTMADVIFPLFLNSSITILWTGTKIRLFSMLTELNIIVTTRVQMTLIIGHMIKKCILF